MKCVTTFSSTSNSGYATTLGPVKAYYPYSGTGSTGVVTNPLYQAYRNLYEETKLIGMKIQLSVTSVVGNSTLPSLEIYTAWDRKYGYGESLPTATQLKAMATSNVATALNNNVAKITRSIYASDLMEKAQWHDSSPVSSSDDTDQAWQTAGANPSFFCPAFYFCFGSPSLASPGTSVGYSISITYYVAFRNPKYGGSSSSKDLPVRQVTFADEPDGDADMEDGDVNVVDVADVEPAARAAADPTPLTRPTASNLGEGPSIKPKGKRHHHEQKNE